MKSPCAATKAQRSEKNVFKCLNLFEGVRGSAVKNLPPMQETQESRVRSLGQEDPVKEEMVTHSSILAWKIP